jgi:hypothetical protein
MAIWLVPAVLGALGVLMFVRGLFAVGKGRALGGGFGALTGGLFMAVGAASALLGLNIQTYQRLTYEQPVAEVTFAQQGPQIYDVTMTLPDGAKSQYVLRGDEWQIDARVIKWKPWANVAGLDASYRLERLGGRYADINAERTAERTVYQLSTNPGLDLWALADQYASVAPVMDAKYGSATYVPMADGATFYVTMSQTGLLARPANDPARAAVESWGRPVQTAAPTSAPVPAPSPSQP